MKSNNRSADFSVAPEFIHGHIKDLVCKGGSMYAFWNGTYWDMDRDSLAVTLDAATKEVADKIATANPGKVVDTKFATFDDSKVMLKLENYIKLRGQSNVEFNKKIMFADDVIKREDYATTQLSYTPKAGDTEAFDELMNTLYAEEELDKILWFIGALLTSNMPKIQKFMYLYGGKGTGKGTVITIFKMLFEGYYSSISLSTLTGGGEFATSQVKEVPLLIDEDSDMSAIKQDTYLLKMTAHEPIPVNVKYQQVYEVTFNGLLITASNQRYKVRNIDSGITRRAVVVAPTNKKVDSKRYHLLMERVKYELPMIAQKAIDLFNEKGSYYYEDYVDLGMAEATDVVFAFVKEHYSVLGDSVTLKRAGELYKLYLEELGYETQGYKRKIKNELSRYYTEFYANKHIGDVYFTNLFVGFKKELLFPSLEPDKVNVPEDVETLLEGSYSPFNAIAEDYPAQYANEAGTPTVAWDKCTTTLKDIDTTKLHYVRIPLNHIVIDFDRKNSEGEKDLATNMAEANKFPPTYTELSKSGKGVHLHYLYDGDVTKLANLYDDDIEIKVFTGKQALRRQVTQFNELPITSITTGLPTKEAGARVYKDVEIISWNEKKMRNAIIGNLLKKYHDSTKSSIDFIGYILDQAQKEGVKYDLTDMQNDVMDFALSSTNQAKVCMKLVNKMVFNTIDPEVDIAEMQKSAQFYPDEELVFFDIEVFPNLFVVAFKHYHDTKKTIWINPSQQQIESLIQMPLVGFNNRDYDNHVLYAAFLGEPLEKLYHISQGIIAGNPNAKFGSAYELSYADIYEYSSEKKSLKKWEIELSTVDHDELGLPWDQPVPEELWERVGEYCGNDVDATEAVFDHIYYDYTARKIIATLSGLKVNAKTTQHAAKFMFGDDPRPQDKFIYTDLSKEFPGYEYSYGKSTYKGIDTGNGGAVYSEPGVYSNVALLDIASQHPRSAIVLKYFGPYAQRFEDLVDTRILVKHGDYEAAGKMFNGLLIPFLQDKQSAKDLAYALKIIINIVYGMTSASFDNKFRHKDNHDNIIAKRGALFMLELKEQVQNMGFTVAHIKTDSIKIPDATQEIIDFVFWFGKQYGYTFEHEHTYNRMALVNKAVYIAQVEDGSWEATGPMFAQPFVYKTLFSHEEMYEQDYAVTMEVKGAAIHLGEKFIGRIVQVYASRTGEEMWRVTPDKKGYVTGTKGKLWKPISEYSGIEDVDMDYYEGLVGKAIAAIREVGSINELIDPFEPVNQPWLVGEPVPF